MIRGLVAAFMLSALFGVSLPAAADDFSALSVEVDDDRVTMTAQNAPLGDVLCALSVAAGFKLLVARPLPQPVTARFSGAPIYVVLLALLRDVDSVTFFKPDGAGGSRVYELRVLGAKAAPPNYCELSIS